MILDASHKNWAIVCAALAVVAAGLYALQAWRLHPVESSGGSVAGLWFGLAGTTLLALAGLLPLRKWYPLARIGSAQSWLRAHIWLSLLGSLLILLHSAFRWRGTIEQWLMLLLALLVASGVWGLIAQSLLTRQLSLQVPLETFYENLPQACRMLQFEGDVLLARLCEEPLPLEPDAAVATDERLKNRGVLGRDFATRLARIYSPTPANPPESPPAVVETPLPAAAAEPAPAEKPLSAADKIALMRAKKSAAPAPAAPSEPVAASTPAAPSDAAAPKAMSTAEKLKLMRAKKPAPVEAVGPAAAEAPANPPPLATKDKLALMRAGKQAAASPAASPVPIESSPSRQLPTRTIQPDTLKPFQHDLRRFFLERVRPFLALDRDGAVGGLHTDATSTIVFARMAAALPAELHEALAQLEALCAQRRQLSTQTRLYHWLHGWLVLVHIPAAAALLGLIIVHVAASLYW